MYPYNKSKEIKIYTYNKKLRNKNISWQVLKMFSYNKKKLITISVGVYI